eukprot:TRINITY_DN15973_c0_g1_i1.p1 TRINITY_DN15973_c0_g1~~TRINITY_DN15973_c0_g1_i1.p1  ORF type:complete len:530 (+),score=205.17 TRINITY_DN15973_c0_g1_i1:55-1590(+)
MAARKSVSHAPGAGAAIEAPVDPADAMFEPTGDLFKDYCAYCEIEDKEERDDILDCVGLEDVKANPRNAQTPDAVHTTLFVRGLEQPLHKHDISPLTNAIPHCSNLYDAKFFNCHLSVDSWKLLVEAVYKSSSLVTVHVDFNPELAKRDPTVSRREGKQEHVLWPSQARGGQRSGQQQQQQPTGAKAAAKDAKKPAPKGKAAEEEAAPSQTPIRTPDGWDAILLTFVKEVSLRGNAIDDAQCSILARGLEANTELLSLNLWGNSITCRGARDLAAALRVNQRLTALNLGDNRLADAGVAALADCLKQADVSDSEPESRFRSLRARVRQHIGDGVLPEEPPSYPTFADLALLAQDAAAGKEVKKPPPKGKGAKGPAGRPEEPWDRDCVRTSDGAVRVPGNRTLWSLNLSNNTGVTAAGVDRCTAVLQLMVPPPPEPQPAADAGPPSSAEKPKRKSTAAEDSAKDPPCNAQGGQLVRLLVGHPKLSPDAIARLEEAVATLAAAREAAAAGRRD